MSEMDLNELLQAAASAYVESQRAKMLQIQAAPPSLLLPPPPPPPPLNSPSSSATSESTSTSPSSQPARKKSRKSISTLSDFLQCYRASHSVQCLSPGNYQSLLQFQCQDQGDPDQPRDDESGLASSTISRSPSYLEHLINAIGHPTVLKGIAEQFLKNVTQSPPK